MHKGSGSSVTDEEWKPQTPTALRTATTAQ